MTKIKICALKDLNRYLYIYDPDVVVSSLTPKEENTVNIDLPLNKKINRIVIPVDDIYNAQIKLYKDGLRRVFATNGDKFLFHCLHGRSRSAAFALAKLYQINRKSVFPFIRDWFERYPQAEPNPLIIMLADELLEAGGNLIRLTAHRLKGRNL